MNTTAPLHSDSFSAFNPLDRVTRRVTQDQVIRELNRVKQTEFTPILEAWMEEYRHIGYRDDFVFRWCYSINRDWRMLDIDEEFHQPLEEVKTLYNVLIVLIDDVAEMPDKGPLLDEMLKITFVPNWINNSGLAPRDREYLGFTLEVWAEIQRRVELLPYHRRMKILFDFDTHQFLSAVRYGYLTLMTPVSINQAEYWTYFPQSMQIMLNADFDLMCCHSFPFEWTGRFRELILVTQQMARIGNWLTTWEREVRAGDMSSVVVPHAVELGLLSPGELETDDPGALVERIKAANGEQHFLDQWAGLYEQAWEIGSTIPGIDIGHILEKFEFLLYMHLISRGAK
jgi:hypothetical protein